MFNCLPVKIYRLWGSAAIALAVGLASCGQSPEKTQPQAETNETATSSEQPMVVASHTIVCDLTEQIAQDTVELNCLFSPGEDPHAYRAIPSDRQAIETAQLVLYGGYNLSPGIDGLIEATTTSVPRVAVFEEAVPNPLMGEEHHSSHKHGEEEHAHEHGEEEHAHEHGEEAHTHDPHVWHDVQNAIAIAEVIGQHLSEVNRDQAEVYTRNTEQLIETLEQLDEWVKQQVATIPEGQRQIVTTHDALGYYVQAYGFEEAESLQGLSTDEDPTPQRVKELVETINQTKVPAIFAETTTNEKAIETVAREANVTVAEQKLYVGSVGEQGSEAQSYVGMIAHNTCAIVNGLGGQCTKFEQN